MKRMKLYMSLGIMGLVSGMLVACHTDYLAYEQEKDGIYLATGAGVLQSYSAFQDWDSSDSLEVTCNFKVLGFPATANRTIRLEMVDSLTTAIEGQDYVVNREIVMPENKVAVVLPVVTWKRRQEGDTRSDTLSVGYRIVENENFRPVQGYTVQFLYKKTIPEKPYNWNQNVLGPWSVGLMYRFVDQYNSLKTTHPDVYASIHVYAGDHFFDEYWPNAAEYLVIKYIVSPLYDYYQEHPEPDVVMIPKPKYE